MARIVELQPDASWAHHLEAFVLREVGREDEAALADERAARLTPQTPTDNDLYSSCKLTLANFTAHRRHLSLP